MNRLMKIVGVVIAVIAIAAIGLGVYAFASPATVAQAAGLDRAGRLAPAAHGGGMRGGFCGQAGMEAAAGALGLTVEELQSQLWGGKTLADLAEEKGLALEDLQAEVEAACAASTKDAIEQAVTDGQITREHADWLLEGLEQGFWGGGRGGPGFGGPGGRGGRGGHGFGGPGGFKFDRPTPSAPTTDS